MIISKNARRGFTAKSNRGRPLRGQSERISKRRGWLRVKLQFWGRITMGREGEEEFAAEGRLPGGQLRECREGGKNG
jgi:hypothetical protein